MPEEVTYATVKFSNTSKTMKPQESCSLKRTDNHEVPELELDGAAGNGTGRIENTVEVAGSRAVRGLTHLKALQSWISNPTGNKTKGKPIKTATDFKALRGQRRKKQPKTPKSHSVLSKVWCLAAFVLLMLNLVVLAGLGTLILMNYQELFFSNRTAYDGERSLTEQWERNIPLFMDICKNVSSEHIILKNKLETTLEALNNVSSKYYEHLKQKKKELKSLSCSASCVCHGDSKKGHCFLMNMDDGKNGNKTQDIQFLELPVHEAYHNRFGAMMNISSAEMMKYAVFNNGNEIIGNRIILIVNTCEKTK